MSYFLWIQPLKEDARYPPNGQIHAAVHWNLEQIPEGIEASLLWEPKWNPIGMQAVFPSIVIGGEPRVEQSQSFVPATASGSQQILFALPSGPYSFHGDVIHIVWRLTVKLIGIDMHYNSEILVTPHSSMDYR